MRLSALVAIALLGCGGRGGGAPPAPEPVKPAAPPPPVELARSADPFVALAASEQHLYWIAGGGLWRRPLGVEAATPERLADIPGAPRWLVPVGDAVYVAGAEPELRVWRDGALEVARRFEEPIWGIARDGARLVVGVLDDVHVLEPDGAARSILVDDPEVEHLGVLPRRLTAGGGVAYVLRTGDDTIVAVDLASGTVTPVLSDELARSAGSLAATADALYVVGDDRIAILPRGGGATRTRAFTSCPSSYGEPCPHAIVADASGFAASGTPVVIAQRTGARARLLATDTVDLTLPGGAAALALGEDRVYVGAGAVGGGHALTAFPRDGGAEVVDLAGSIYEMEDGGGHVWATVEVGEGRYELVRIPVDGGEPRRLHEADDLRKLAVDGDVAVVERGTSIIAVRADGGAPTVLGELAGDLEALAIGGGRGYWLADHAVWSAPLDGSKPAAKVVTLPVPDWDGGIAIGAGTVYVSAASPQGRAVYAVTAAGEARQLWVHLPDRSLDDPPMLHTMLVFLDGNLYVEVGSTVVRIDPSTGAYTTILDDSTYKITSLDDSDGRLFAREWTIDPDVLLEIPLDGSAARVVMRSYGDVRSFRDAVVIGDEVVVHSYWLQALLIVRAGQVDAR